MIGALPVRIDSVRSQQKELRWASWSGYLAVVGVGLLVGVAGLGYPQPFAVALGVLLCIAVAIVVRPITGVFFVAFFTVLGDASTMEPYPFISNFSGRGSWLFVSDKLTFSPLELCIALTFVGWFVQAAGARDWRLAGRPLLRPILVFGAFVFFGLVYGLGVGGGNLTAAFWEVRPLLYLIAVFVLASNLITSRAQYVGLAWVVVAAISIQSVFALKYYLALPPDELEQLEGLTDHPASLIYAWVLLVVLALWTLPRTTLRARLLVSIAALPTTMVFIVSQRRAAIIGLGAGFFVFVLILFFRRRKAFMVIVPIALVLTVGYTAAFWNTTDGVGFGAQAIKSVVAPDSVSVKDASSDLYRNIENYDLAYTIRAEPLTGVGFGKPFYRPAELPNISFFAFYEYIPHNSVLWIWLKVGFFGFVALLFALAVVLRAGVRAALSIPSGDALAITIGALAFVVMFVTFAFVDIAWVPQSCVFLGICMATCANMARMARYDDGSDAVAAGASISAPAETGAGPTGRVPAGRVPAGRVPAGRVPAGRGAPSAAGAR